MNPGLGTPAAFVVLGTGALVWRVRRTRGLPPGVRWTLWAALAASEVTQVLWPVVAHSWTAAIYLPLQLSDLATFVAIAALTWPQRLGLQRLAYLWGLPAGLLGLSFPAIGASPPSPLYYAFWVDHGALFALAVLLGVSGGIQMSWRVVVEAWLATTLLAVLDGVANLATGGDYMFLRQPPPGWNPLWAMGPWPWYVVAAFAICPALFRLAAVPLWGTRGTRTGGGRALGRRSAPT